MGRNAKKPSPQSQLQQPQEQQQQLVCVTGATGYIASHLVKQLLEKGYSIRASVRDPSNTQKNKHILQLPGAKDRLELFKADLLEPGTFDQAMKGCVACFHTASPYKLDVADPIKDLVEPAIKGTENVLEACRKSGSVQTVVYTSSVGAIYCGPRSAGEIYTEKDWNEISSPTHNPYFYSKGQAERAARAFVEKLKDGEKFKLLVLHPGSVIGPALTKEINESVKISVYGLMVGQYPALLDFGSGMVDVRDVAKAHILALEKSSKLPNLFRCILVSQVLTLLQMKEECEKKYPGYKYPWNFYLPSFPARLLAPWLFDAGTAAFLVDNVGRGPLDFSSRVAKEQLGMEFIDAFKSLDDTAEDLIKWGNVPANP